MLLSKWMKLCIFVGLNVGSYVGWTLAENAGVTMAFLSSSVGSVIGVYAGWRIARTYLS